MNARRRRGKQIIYEESEEHRRDNRALGYTSIVSVQIRKEAVDSDGNRPIRQKITNRLNESVTETKHW